MKVSVKLPDAAKNSQLLNDIKELASTIEDERRDTENEIVTIVLNCEPGMYKQICDLIELQTNGKGSVAILLLNDLVDE